MTERVDSVWDLEEEKMSSVGSLYFEDTEEDGSGSSGDIQFGHLPLFEDEPDDPRVQEEVSVVEMLLPIAPRYVTS